MIAPIMSMLIMMMSMMTMMTTTMMMMMIVVLIARGLQRPAKQVVIITIVMICIFTTQRLRSWSAE